VTAVVDSRYELGERIASGGVSDVFAARDRTLDRRVAIKRLRADLPDEGVRERFTREASALAGFSHPNAVAVYDAGDDPGGPYIVMELVDGPTLAAYLREHQRLSFEEATHILEQMLAVLGAAHAQGIVHRDVKPANVLLADGGQVKLADFGIAKVLSDASAELTLSGYVMGTPTYLAPERAAGHDATPASDLYSAAVIGYEIVAGKPPFKGEHVAATLVAHQRAPIPSLLEVRPDAPPAYVAAIERGLAKDPGDRFGSAEEMRDALAQPACEETMAVRTQTMPLPPVPPAGPVPPAARPKPPPRPPEPEPKEPKEPRAPRRPVWPWVLVAALVLGLVAGAIVGLTGDHNSLPSTSQEPTVTTTPPTLPATLVPQIRNLSQVIALLAADPTKFGSAGPELLKKLQAYQADPEADKAADLVKQVSEWVAKGQLDRDFATLVLQLLGTSSVTPPATAAPAPAPAAGHGPKGGNGRGPKG
jgi:serine/threonine-protein kinase